jgi:hypothetical protein
MTWAHATHLPAFNAVAGLAPHGRPSATGAWQGWPRCRLLGSAWWHRTPSRGNRRSGPPRPVPVDRPIGVWLPHVAAPDPWGVRACGGQTRAPCPCGHVEAPDLYEHGGKVWRLCPQLSGPDRTPCHPEDKGEATDNLMPILLDTLLDDLLTDEAAENADLLGADHHDLLVVEQLLGHDREKVAEHVVARVHHDALGAHAGARHHRALTCEAAVAL